jgi:hypothetical protein
MRVYKDKLTSKWKIGSNGKAIYESKEQAQRAALDNLAEMLSTVKRKINEGALGYGR